MLTEATEEIEKYCATHDWVNQIKSYVNEWHEENVREWKSKNGANEIEDQLTKIRSWIEKIKTGIEKIVITENRILRVDTRPIEKLLVPRLEKIYIEICEFTINEITHEAKTFSDQIKKILKV